MEINLHEIINDSIEWNVLEAVLMEMVKESIDYEEIAAEILESINITEIIKEKILMPF